jgi:hypothetical protein
MKECVCNEKTELYEKDGFVVCKKCGGQRGKTSFYGTCRKQMEMMLERHNEK